MGKITHNGSRTKLYKVWSTMLGRCENKNNKFYYRYGKRGIIVCKEWHDFSNFYNWAKENGYTIGLCIDRINNDGNYEPKNCKFITNKENNAFNKKGKRTDNKSGVTGVHWDSNNFKWYVQFNGKYLGRYKDLEDAKAIRLNAEKQYEGVCNGN